MPDEDLGQITSSGDVVALQKAIKADLENIRSSLVRCANAGTFSPDKTPGEWDSWQSMKQRAQDYVDEGTPFLGLGIVSMFERGQQVQKELAGWHDRAKALGCDAGPAPLDISPATTPLFSFGGLSSMALLAIAILYLWGKNKT